MHSLMAALLKNSNQIAIASYSLKLPSVLLLSLGLKHVMIL